MLSSKHSIKWENIPTETIQSKKTAEGVKYLELFLFDYAKLLNKQNLNASCGKCIRNYHKEYIENIMTTESKYVLKKKYIGIYLRKNPSFRVNNSNITDKIGSALLKEKGDHIFEKFPKPVKKTPKKKVVND